MNRADSIENFIREHRLAFDVATPGAYNWTRVEKDLARLAHADTLETEVLLNRIVMNTQAPHDSVWAGIEQWLDKHNDTTPDPLEHFIRHNREAFDEEIPDLKVWANIAGKTPVKARIVHINWQRTFIRAAASVALLVTGLGLGIWYARSGDTPAMAMGDVSSEYAELEQHYQRDIAGKQQKLATFTGSQPAEVHEDLEHLDLVMNELRQELANVPAGNRQQVVRAMIENYKAKASILERVLERLEESTKTETKNINSDNEIKSI